MNKLSVQQVENLNGGGSFFGWVGCGLSFVGTVAAAFTYQYWLVAVGATATTSCIKDQIDPS